MTEQEKQEIISAVLSSLRTNSKAIEQLTSVTEMLDDDQIELNGGRKVSYAVLMSAFNDLVSRDDLNALTIIVNALRTTVDTKADTVAVGGVRWLKLAQWPFAALFSVEQVADSSVSNNKMYWGTNGNLKYKDNNSVVTDLGSGPRYGVLYYVDNDIYRWNGTGFTKMGGAGISAEDIIDSLTSGETGKALSANMGRELKTQLDTRYNKTSANVDTLAAKVDALIDIVGGLAALAFTGAKPTTPTKVGSFDWSVSDGGSSTTPVLTSPAAGSRVNVGQIPAGQTSVSYGILIRGSNFTGGVSLAVSGSGFSINKSSFTASEVNNGVTVFVTYTNEGTTAAQAIGSLTISGGGITRTVELSASKAADGGGEVTTHTISFNSPDNSLVCTPANGWTVESGNPWNGTIRLASGVTGKQIPQTLAGIQINGSHGDVNYDAESGWLAIDSITSDITITASAENAAVEGYAVTNRLLNMTSTGAASVNSGEDYSATIKPTSGSGASSNNDLRIYIGGTRLPSSAFEFNQDSGVLLIPANLITGDITIEATACTGVVKVKASEAATININGTAHSLSGTGDWETIGTNITAITLISAISADRSKFTAFDFGGAVASGFFSGAVGFVSMTSVTSIKGLVIKATDGSASMDSAFYECRILSELDTIGWDLTAVTTFRNCFYNCRALTSIDVTGWVSDACTKLDSMFKSCIALASIVGLNTWDVSNVTTMADMFSVSSSTLSGSLNTLDVSGWNTTSALTSMDRWVQYSSITRLVIGNLVTSGLASVNQPLQTNAPFTLVCTNTTPPALNATNNLVISQYHKIGKIVVPSQAALTAYKADANWNQFTGTWEVSQ